VRTQILKIKAVLVVTDRDREHTYVICESGKDPFNGGARSEPACSISGVDPVDVRVECEFELSTKCNILEQAIA
jgi:hypothetical protein